MGRTNIRLWGVLLVSVTTALSAAAGGDSPGADAMAKAQEESALNLFRRTRNIIQTVPDNQKGDRLKALGLTFGKNSGGGQESYNESYFYWTPSWVMFTNDTPYPVTVKIDGAIPSNNFDVKEKTIPAGQTLLNGVGVWHVNYIKFWVSDSSAPSIKPAYGKRYMLLPRGDITYARVVLKNDKAGNPVLKLVDTVGLDYDPKGIGEES